MLKVKVCGINDRQNLPYLDESDVDFVGFIFYEKSVRYFEKGDITRVDLQNFSKKKVGVFVDEAINEIERIAKKYQLDYIQLHGKESPIFCEKLINKGYKVIKAIAIEKSLPNDLHLYENNVDYFLFDTKGKLHGGSGQKFDWDSLDSYSLKTPFFLSGGIGVEDVEQIRSIQSDKLMAVDINSRFEVSPGSKDETKTQYFINQLKHE